MKIDLDSAELHSPLFLGGKNHQLKLAATERTGVKLVYDRAEKELLVSWRCPLGKDHLGIVPLSNVAVMCPAKEDAEATKLQAKVEPVILHKHTAQVSSPTDHVFAGPGKGKR